MNYCGDESLIRECVRSGSSFSTLHNEVVFLDTTCPKYEHWVYINTCINEPVIRLKLANMASTLKAKVSESGCPCVGSLMCAALNNNKSTQHAKSRKHNTKKSQIQTISWAFILAWIAAKVTLLLMIMVLRLFSLVILRQRTQKRSPIYTVHCLLRKRNKYSYVQPRQSHYLPHSNEDGPSCP